MPFSVTRVTHASVLLDFDGQVLLTDPWFSEKPGYFHGEPRPFTPAAFPRLSGVLASHRHYDHYDMEAFAAYPDKSLPILVKRGIARTARDTGFTNVTELDHWEVAELDGVKVTATPSMQSRRTHTSSSAAASRSSSELTRFASRSLTR